MFELSLHADCNSKAQNMQIIGDESIHSSDNQHTQYVINIKITVELKYKFIVK